jgi:hypothetical protein
MLDANLFAAMRIGPARDVTSGKYAWRARLQIGVDDNAAIKNEPGFFGKFQSWAHADAYVNAGVLLQRLAGAKVQQGCKQKGPRYRGPFCLSRLFLDGGAWWRQVRDDGLDLCLA